MTPVEQKLTLRTDTKTYTIKDIKNEIEECRKILISLGYKEMEKLIIEAKISSRLTKTYGNCRMDIPNTRYIITISKNLIDYGSPAKTHNTIMHEMCHALNGCMNHGTNWKRAANLVNSYYVYTPIQRTSCDKEYHENFYDDYRASLNKYRIECKGCGTVWKYKKLCNTVRACQRGGARCTKCGSKSFDVTYKV